jgi:hypothetical protein
VKKTVGRKINRKKLEVSCRWWSSIDAPMVPGFALQKEIKQVVTTFMGLRVHLLFSRLETSSSLAP